MNLGTSNVLDVLVQAVTYALGTVMWKSELTVLGVNNSYLRPGLSLFVRLTVVGNAGIALWRYRCIGSRTIVWSSGSRSGSPSTSLVTAVISRWCASPNLTWSALALVALFWSALTNKLFATLVLSSNDGTLVVLTAFWLWALDVSAFLWYAYVLVATVVDLVSHELLVKCALWNFWTVSVEALNVSLFTARTYSADITVLIPGFLKHSWALVLVNAVWLFWFGWNARVGWTTLALYWWMSLDGTTADNLGFFNGWADLFDVVTDTAILRALAWVFWKYSDQLVVESAFQWVVTLWWSVLAEAKTVDNLIAALGIIDVLPFGVIAIWASIWKALVLADNWLAVTLALFVTSTDFTVLRGPPCITNLDVVTVWS